MLVASPGTGVLDTLSTALTRGSRAGIAAAFGCTLGILPAMPAAVGLAAVRIPARHGQNSALNYSIRASGWASFAVFVLDVSSLAS